MLRNHHNPPEPALARSVAEGALFVTMIAALIYGAALLGWALGA